MAEFQELTIEEIVGEIPLLGLRMHKGIDWDLLRETANNNGLISLFNKWEMELEKMIQYGLLEKTANIIRLTPKGMLLSNAVFGIFIKN